MHCSHSRKRAKTHILHYTGKVGNTQERHFLSWIDELTKHRGRWPRWAQNVLITFPLLSRFPVGSCFKFWLAGTVIFLDRSGPPKAVHNAHHWIVMLDDDVHLRGPKCGERTWHTITPPPAAWTADTRQDGSLLSCCSDPYHLNVAAEMETHQTRQHLSNLLSHFVELM